MINKLYLAGILGCILFSTTNIFGQRYMEDINRGLVAVRDGNGYLVYWRLLGTEAHNTAFNLYRGNTLVNSSPITTSTNYRDDGAPTNSSYTVRPVVNGVEGPASEEARVLSNNFLSIPLAPQGSNTPNDASVGDLDGDGEYEIVLKTEQNPIDNASNGHSYETKLEAYKLDGTFMWRINMGTNIREGAHYTQFMVADLDGDGSAEIAVKTADGTVDGLGNVIGDPNADWENGNGYILEGPEYFTIFSGRTGEELATADYLPGRGNVGSWGGNGGNGGNDSKGNRVDRFLAAVAYLDGELPSVVMCRGYYGRSALAAWDYRDGTLTQRWLFDTGPNSGDDPYAGQGAHSISVADVDNDGKDEIIYGAMTVDDDGTGLYSTGLRHGDALHVSDFDPSRPGLEVYMIHENEGNANSSPGSALHSAETGEVYWQTQIGQDVGRGMAADILADNPGAEFWQNNGGLYDVNGDIVGNRPSETNFGIWWDGDLLREMLNGNSITKPSGGNMNLNASGCSSNNGSKSTPALSVDIWGDWREEVIFKCGNNELRIFTTRFETEYKFHTLMHDPVYRLAIAWQNVAYNQPPHVGFFLGAGMDYPPEQPNIRVGDVVSVKNKASKHFASANYSTISVFNRASISLPHWIEEGSTVQVLDLKGKKLALEKVENGVLKLTSKSLRDGIYFVKPAE